MGGRRERLSFVLTPTEKSLVEQLAEIEGGLSLAATIRRMIRQAARQHGLGANSQNQLGRVTTTIVPSASNSGGRDASND